MLKIPALDPRWATEFLERLPESVGVYAPDGRVLFVNSATCEIFGRAREDLVGRNLWEVFPEAVGNRFHRVFHDVAESGASAVFEFYYPPFERWFENTISLVDGCLFVVARDVTAKKKAEAEHERGQAEIIHTQSRLEAYADRLRVLADASTLLATAPLEVDEIARRAAEFLSGHFIGGCYIVRVSGEYVEPLAFFDRDPSWRREFGVAFGAPVPLADGISGQVARSGAPVLIEHMEPEAARRGTAGIREFMAAYGPRSLIVAPMSGRGSMLSGAVGVMRREGTPPFEPRDLDLLVELAQRIGLSMENAHSYEQAQAEKTRAESVLEITRRLERVTRSISRALSPMEMADAASAGIMAALQADAVSLYELAADGELLHLFHSVGVPEALQGKYVDIPLELDAPLAESVRDQRAIVVHPNDYPTRYPVSHQRLRAAGESREMTMACVPLLVETTAYGAVAVTFYRERHIEEWERRFITVVADHCALALARARAFAELAQSAARLDESNRTLAAVIAATPVAVLLLDLDGTVRLWNEAAERIFGWSAPEVLGKVLPAVPGERRAEFRANLQRTASGQRIANLETTRLTKQGGAIDVTLWAAPVFHDDRPTQCLWLLEDISERKRVERDREAARAALEHTAAELSSAYARVKIAERRKDEFLAMLGHELRNPLAPIRTALHLMRLRGDNLWERERNVIERQVQHLEVLVDDLLDVSRITRGKVELKAARVGLNGILTKAVEMASPLLEQKSHRLSLDLGSDELRVYGDDARLSQVFCNLLTNAAKYTDAGGEIQVSVRSEEGQACVAVRDNGMGIDTALLPHIFDLFVQAPQNIARSHGGLGLGLTIVRSLVELHGGSVEVHSDGPGHGSEFRVMLPTSEHEHTSEVPSSRGRARVDSTRQRVLIVDDNEDAADLMGDALSAIGHEVRIEHDGPSALRAVAEFEPKVVLLDIGLPVMDGYEVAQRIRALPGMQVKLIALTGYGQPEDRERALSVGFDNHLVKPVDLQQVFDAIGAATSVSTRPPASAK